MIATSYMLADGLGGALTSVWAASGLACLGVAIFIEIPIMFLIWRRASWKIAGLIIVANIASAFLGGIQSASRYNPLDMTSDPWAVHGRFWQEFLPWVEVLFAATCVVELLCLLPLRIKKNRRVRLDRLVAGTIGGNIASYLLLIWIIWSVPPRGTGDFEFLPDTSWVQANDSRVWFVDPDSNRLCSIRLDGLDRRFESDRELARFHYVEDICVYALIPDQKIVLYVDTDHKWRLRQMDMEYPLITTNHEEMYIPMRMDVFEWLPKVLPAVIAPPDEKAEALEGIYFSGGVHYWRITARSDTCLVLAHYAGTLQGGRWGIQVTNQSGEALHFGIKRDITQMFCRDPEILSEEDLILFRCGGWIMVMDPAQRKVGQLVRGENMVTQTPFFTTPTWRE